MLRSWRAPFFCLLMQKGLLICFIFSLTASRLFAQQEVVNKLVSNVNQITLEEKVEKDFLLLEVKKSSRKEHSELIYDLQNIDPEIKKLLKSQKEDGSWPDINYADSSPSKWDPSKHAQRFKVMAQAYKLSTSNYYNSKKMSVALHHAMGFWFEKKLVCPNWWYNNIGIPMWMGPGFLLIKDELSAEEMINAQYVMKQKVYRATGQNKVWEAGNMALYGLLSDNLDLVKVAQDSISSELFITTNEGLQPDYSYHQHGAQMQFGNYGLSYLTSMAFWIRGFAGTPLAIDKEKCNMLVDYVSKGMNWTMWRGRMDVAACGRQVIQDAQKFKCISSCIGVMNLIASDKNNAEKLHGYIQENLTEPTGANSLIGHHYFWRSEYAVHRTPSWFASVRMNSARTKGIEMTNNENLLGHYAADGVMSILLTGDEYENIFPIWNWRRLPGLTVQDSVNATVDYSTNRSEFVGGVSDGVRGVEANIVKHDGLTAYKSYFFIDNQIVCLGAGIKTDRKVPVFTTLDQSIAKGKVRYFTSLSKKYKTLKSESEIQSSDIQGVYHHQIGYLLLSPSKTSLSNRTVKGNWSKTAKFYVNKPDSGKVFQFTIEHGKRPQGLDYAYSIWPTISKADFIQNAPKTTAKILLNNNQCQAVTDATSTKLGAVFYAANQLEWNKLLLKTENAGLILMDKISEGQFKIVVSDPTKKLNKFALVLSGKYSNETGIYDAATNQTRFEIPLPTDDVMAGSSVSLSI